MTPKYKIGDTFYKLNGKTFLEYKVTNIHISESGIKYTVANPNCQVGSFSEVNIETPNCFYFPTAEGAAISDSNAAISNKEASVEYAKKNLKLAEENLLKVKNSAIICVREAKKLDKSKKKI